MKLASYFVYKKFGNECLYTCCFVMASITERETDVTGLVGEHGRIKNVKAIWFANQIVNYFPRGLHKIFPNVVAVGVEGCDLLEVSREDFEGFVNLTYLYLHANKLKSLPVDLFEGMSKLKEVSIIDNEELKTGITSKLFEPILQNGLTYVDLSKNGNINFFYCPGYKGTLSSVTALMTAIGPDEWTSKFLSLEELWRTKCDFDCYLVGDFKKFEAHKKVLSAHSSMFESIFEREKKLKIFFLGYTESAMKEFLRFMYLNEPPSLANVVEVFKIAVKTGVVFLKPVCEDIISRNVDRSNAFRVFILGKRYDSEKLKLAATSVIKKMFPEREVEIINNLERMDEVKPRKLHEKSIRTYRIKSENDETKVKLDFYKMEQTE